MLLNGELRIVVTTNIIIPDNTHYLASQAEFWSKYRLKRGVKLEETDQIMGV